MLILLKRNSNLLTWLYYMKSSIAEQKRGGRGKKINEIGNSFARAGTSSKYSYKSRVYTVTALCNSCHSKKAAAHS